MVGFGPPPMGLITISNRKGHTLEQPSARRGSWLYFSFRHVHFATSTGALLGREHVHYSLHNKITKLIRQN